MSTDWDTVKTLLDYPGAGDWIDADDVREAMEMRNGGNSVATISEVLMARREE